MVHVKRAILLINIGSPDSFRTKDVKRYLRQFLSDGRVINIPAFFRYLLVYLIIVPFRGAKSAAKYKEIWTKKGSPLIYHSFEVREKLSQQLKDEADVYVAMRYGNPGIKQVLKTMEDKNYSEIVLCPMYPQNASSTTSSSLEFIFEGLKKWVNIPSIKIIGEFWQHPNYQKALATRVAEYDMDTYDHIIISFHGLPLNQVYQAHKGKSCDDLHCTTEWKPANTYCYQATCYQTAHALAQTLNLEASKFSIGFQSRLSKKWLSPFTDDMLVDLARNNNKKVLVICPSFVADCLETVHEIGIEYAEIFEHEGGEQLDLVPALNSEDYWIDNLKTILLN